MNYDNIAKTSTASLYPTDAMHQQQYNEHIIGFKVVINEMTATKAICERTWYQTLNFNCT